MLAKDTSALKSLLLHFGGLTFAEEEGLLRVPNKLIREVVIEKALEMSKININSTSYWKAIDALFDEVHQAIVI